MTNDATRCAEQRQLLPTPLLAAARSVSSAKSVELRGEGVGLIFDLSHNSRAAASRALHRVQRSTTNIIFILALPSFCGAPCTPFRHVRVQQGRICVPCASEAAYLPCGRIGDTPFKEVR